MSLQDTLFNKKRASVAMVSWGEFISLWPQKDSMIFFNLYFNYWVQFLELWGPLSFFDYAVFCETEILIETRAVLLFLEKESNNLWSPSYMQDLIKSLMEVTNAASAETQLFFIHEQHVLSLRSQTEISIMHGGCGGVGVCVSLSAYVKIQNTGRFLLLRVRLHNAPWFSSEDSWSLLNSRWFGIILHLLLFYIWDSGKGVWLFCWCKGICKAGVYAAKWGVLQFFLWYSRESCLFPPLKTFMNIMDFFFIFMKIHNFSCGQRV